MIDIKNLWDVLLLFSGIGILAYCMTKVLCDIADRSERD